MDFIQAPESVVMPLGTGPGLQLLIVLVLGVMLGWIARGIYFRDIRWRIFPRRSTFPRNTRSASGPSSARKPNLTVVAPDPSDPLHQMRYVAAAAFQTRPLLNKEEYGVLTILEETVFSLKSGHRVMAQTSLGEVLAPERGNLTQEYFNGAFASINSKRLDFAVFDRRGTLVLAIEYQGSGHYHQNSFMRDAVKREALRKAGVPLLEVLHGYVRSDVALQIRRALGAAPEEARPQPRPEAERDAGVART